MEKYLKSYQHYADLYDRHTVEHCRKIEQLGNDEDVDQPKDKKISKKQAANLNATALKLYLHFETGERYLNKEKTIHEWMERDRKKDDFYEFTEPFEDIRCLTCRNRMKPIHKELWPEFGKPDRILFMYECPNKCLPHRAFFSDGKEWRIKSKPKLCPKCYSVFTEKIEDDDTKLTTTLTCPKCGYNETDEHVWAHITEDKRDETFAKDRDRFCLTSEDGKKYQEEKQRIEELGRMLDKFTEAEKDRAEKLKANPNGFHLDGAGYTCAICGHSTPEGDNWYDQWGIKCLVCQKAIDEGEIPAFTARDRGSWYTKYDLESAFNIKGPALRSWLKAGVIKARTITRYGKGIHMQLFLVKDNKGFLPPKKLVQSRMIKEIKDGAEWIHTEPWYRFVDPRKHLKKYKIMEYLNVVELNESREAKTEKE
jgi:hypothetical protein